VTRALRGTSRRRLLGLPGWVMFCSTAIWLPGTLVAFSWERLTPDLAASYETSRILFAACVPGLVAISYSGILIALISLRAIFPRLWVGSSQIRQSASKELARFRSRIKLYYFLAAWAPLMAAALAFIDPGASRLSPTVLISSL